LGQPVFNLVSESIGRGCSHYGHINGLLTAWGGRRGRARDLGAKELQHERSAHLALAGPVGQTKQPIADYWPLARSV